MENESIIILSEIRTILYAILGIVSAIGITFVIRSIIVIRSSVKEAKRDVFKELANDLLEEGNVSELISYCNDTLIKKPNNALALWWLGKAYFQKEDYINAKECFRKVLLTEPDWEKSHIEPYLKKISGLSE